VHERQPLGIGADEQLRLTHAVSGTVTWQAASWPAAAGRSRGVTSEQVCTASGQRERKRQPSPGATTLRGSPPPAEDTKVGGLWAPWAEDTKIGVSGFGTADSSSRV